MNDIRFAINVFPVREEVKFDHLLGKAEKMTAILGGIAGIAYMCKDAIVSSVQNLAAKQCGIVKIVISESPKMVYALKQCLRPNQILEASDCGSIIDYSLPPGSYVHHYQGIEIRILIGKEEIMLYTVWNSVTQIQNFLNDQYHQHCSPERMLMFYISDTTWKCPVFRRPRDKHLMLQRCTPDMNQVLADVANFINSENHYLSQARPYRRGYLLSGPPGTGKSTLVELIAMLYNRSVYLINFDTKMTDTILINLCSQVPPRSIIVIEEIEKQLETLNREANITLGGILSAIDGPQRLSHGTIIILTANNIEGLNPALLRPGRIDKHLTLLTKIH